jgi:hypothetical protein
MWEGNNPKPKFSPHTLLFYLYSLLSYASFWLTYLDFLICIWSLVLFLFISGMRFLPSMFLRFLFMPFSHTEQLPYVPPVTVRSVTAMAAVYKSLYSRPQRPLACAVEPLWVQTPDTLPTKALFPLPKETYCHL